MERRCRKKVRCRLGSRVYGLGSLRSLGSGSVLLFLFLFSGRACLVLHCFIVKVLRLRT